MWSLAPANPKEEARYRMDDQSQCEIIVQRCVGWTDFFEMSLLVLDSAKLRTATYQGFGRVSREVPPTSSKSITALPRFDVQPHCQAWRLIRAAKSRSVYRYPEYCGDAVQKVGTQKPFRGRRSSRLTKNGARATARVGSRRQATESPSTGRDGKCTETLLIDVTTAAVLTRNCSRFAKWAARSQLVCLS